MNKQIATVEKRWMRILPAILFILAGMHPFIILALFISNHQHFLLSEKINLPLNFSLLLHFLPGWGHFFLNAAALVITSLIELKKPQIWSYFIILVTCLWVVSLDLLGTRFYIDILPTPIFPAICSLLALWILRKKISFPMKKSFSEFYTRTKLGILYGLSLFVIGAVSLLGTINYKFIPIDFPYTGKEKNLLLAIAHIGWANLSGQGLILISLFRIEEQITDNSIKLKTTFLCSTSFLILLTTAFLEKIYIVYFFIPLTLGSIILIKMLFSQRACDV